MAYALKQAHIERERCMTWTTKWDEIRKRARDVSEQHLGNNEIEKFLEALYVEVDDDESETEDELL